MTNDINHCIVFNFSSRGRTNAPFSSVLISRQSHNLEQILHHFLVSYIFVAIFFISVSLTFFCFLEVLAIVSVFRDIVGVERTLYALTLTASHSELTAETKRNQKRSHSKTEHISFAHRNSGHVFLSPFFQMSRNQIGEGIYRQKLCEKK